MIYPNLQSIAVCDMPARLLQLAQFRTCVLLVSYFVARGCVMSHILTIVMCMQLLHINILPVHLPRLVLQSPSCCYVQSPCHLASFFILSPICSTKRPERIYHVMCAADVPTSMILFPSQQ